MRCVACRNSYYKHAILWEHTSLIKMITLSPFQYQTIPNITCCLRLCWKDDHYYHYSIPTYSNNTRDSRGAYQMYPNGSWLPYWRKTAFIHLNPILSARLLVTVVPLWKDPSFFVTTLQSWPEVLPWIVLCRNSPSPLTIPSMQSATTSICCVTTGSYVTATNILLHGCDCTDLHPLDDLMKPQNDTNTGEQGRSWLAVTFPLVGPFLCLKKFQNAAANAKSSLPD